MSDQPSAQQVIMLTADEVHRRVADGTAYIVDVREPHETAQIRISGAHLVPLSGFDADQIMPGEGQDLILHCRIGQRCGVAAELLVARGFPGTIHRMTGGILEWMAADFPVETG